MESGGCAGCENDIAVSGDDGRKDFSDWQLAGMMILTRM